MIRTLLILAFGAFGVAYAQQIPQYSQYVKNQYLVNPAATGADDYVSINIGGRMQWVGFPEAPKTTYLYVSSPIGKLKSSLGKRTYGRIRRNRKSVKHPNFYKSKVLQAYGGHIVADQFGAFKTLKLMGSYAVHIPLSRKYKLSFGLNLGLSSRSFIQEKAQVLSSMVNTGYTDETYANYLSNRSPQYVMDLDAGLYFHGEGIFVGFAAKQLTGDLVKFGNTSTDFDPRINYLFSGGYKFNIGKDMSMTPAILMKYMVNTPLVVDGTIQFDYMERFWFGSSYRHKDAVVLTVGAYFWNKLKLGYSVDITTSKIRTVSTGAGHELVIGLMLGKKDPNYFRKRKW